MLEFLVTAKARRRLLVLLWSDRVSGSATELARRAGVGFASAHRELQAMHRLDLVNAVRSGRETLFAANDKHVLAEPLRKLLAASEQPRAPGRADDSTRRRLAALGAPVVAARGPVSRSRVEQALVQGVSLAHRDPALARSLPVAFYRQRDRVDPRKLFVLARDGLEKPAVGLFLELTAQLSGDRRFAAWARRLRDRRVRTKHPFFYTRAAAVQAATQPDRSPPVARRWGFRLDMTFDDFRALFDKAQRAA